MKSLSLKKIKVYKINKLGFKEVVTTLEANLDALKKQGWNLVR